MAMDNVDALLHKTIESITSDSDFLQHRNLLVVGKNMTGKTCFSKKLIEALPEGEKDSFYFIGPYNRTIVSGYTSSKFSDYSVREITEERNKIAKDIFSTENDGSEGAVIAYQELIKNLLLSDLSGGTGQIVEITDEIDITEVDYSSLVWQFLELDLRRYEDKSTLGMPQGVVSVNNGNEIIINDDLERKINSLSSSEMTTTRIILEVLYAQKKSCKYVLIDEFDTYYDLENLQLFVEKLTSTFRNIRFILVIHNLEALVRIKDMDVIIIQKLMNGSTDASIHDANYIDSISILDAVLSRRYKSLTAEIDSLLGNCIMELFSNKKIGDINLGKYLALDYTQLSTREKIMYDYVTKLKEKYES